MPASGRMPDVWERVPWRQVLAAAKAAVATLGDLALLDTVDTTEIDDEAVTYAKMQHVSATDKVLGRSTAGAGDVEEIACTAAGRALLDDADASAQRTTLGLAIGTDVQAHDADLAEIAALSNVAGDILYTDATPAWARLAKGTDGHVLKLASGLPTWAAESGGAGGGFTSVALQVFTSSGTYTPTSGMAYAILVAVGGGGGGGGSDCSDFTAMAIAGGGGGGGTAIEVATAATIGASQTVTIGSGGTGGSNTGGNGSSGGDSSVGALCTGGGGSNGNGATASFPSVLSDGGSGGVATGGDLNINGGDGFPGDGNYVGSGARTGAGGAGGGTLLGGSTRPDNGPAGRAAVGYGAGGSGSVTTDSTTGNAGGDGQDGVVAILEFIA